MLQQVDRRCCVHSKSHLPLEWLRGLPVEGLLHSMCMMNPICKAIDHKLTLSTTDLRRWLGSSWRGYAND